MENLYYPTIDVFIYNLRSPLNVSSENMAYYHQLFKARLPSGVQIEDKANEINSPFLELLPSRTFKLSSANPDLEDISFYPVALNDTYGLKIGCSVANLYEPQSIYFLQKIKTQIEPYCQEDNGTIGQTWLISGWLASENQNIQEAAKDCYQAIFPQESWQYVKKKYGLFLDSQIIAIEQLNNLFFPYIIIVLFANKEKALQGAEFYSHWMGLFCYKHKIVWAYRQSQKIKNNLIEHYREIEQYTKTIKKNRKANINLQGLQNLFNDIHNIINKYTKDLIELSFQKQVIDINLYNYRTRLEKIKEEAGKESDLSFLDEFSHFGENVYLQQIDKDITNMQLGLQLLETNINELRSQLELETAERDRNFQTLVTIVAGGTALYSIFDLEDQEPGQGKRCSSLVEELPEGSIKEFFDCDKFIESRILMPFLLILISGIFILILQKIIAEFFVPIFQSFLRSKN